MKRIILILVILVLLISSSCSTVDILNRSYSDLSASDKNTANAFNDVNLDFTHKSYKANLYYRYKGSNLLASEYRNIDVRSGEIPEFAIIKELLKGPKIDPGQLENPFQSGIEVLNAVPIYNNKILAVTFSEDFLMKEKRYENNDIEILERKLMLNSIVLSVTDNFSYMGVQIFIKPDDENLEAYRLDNSFLFQDNTLPMLALIRDDSFIANHINVCSSFLDAWQKRDIDIMNLFIDKPIGNEKLANMIANKDISDFSVSSGNVYNDDNNATVSVRIDIANSVEYIVFPFKLVKDGTVWKADYENFKLLLSYIGV